MILAVDLRRGVSPHREFPLLPRHGDPEPFLGVDEVVMIIFAEIELHPVDLAGEPAVACGVVGV